MAIDPLHRILVEAGLSENEASVYLGLAAIGSGTAYHVSQNCDVKKATVYVTLEDLRRKGLVLKVPHAKRTLFTAVDFDEYLRSQESRIRAARSVLPRLRDLSVRTAPNVFYYEGINGVLDAMNFRLNSMIGETFFSFYGSLAKCSEQLIDVFERWDKNAPRKDIRFKIILPRLDSDTRQHGLLERAQEYPEQFELKFLDNYQYPSNLSYEIGKDFVRSINAKDITATVTDDASAAQAMREIFTMVWNK